MLASNISTIHLVGLALFFAPFSFRSGISTLPEFLKRRYSSTARTFLAAIAIFGALLAHIGISLFAGAKLFEAFLGIPVIWSFLIILAVTVICTVICTVLGGLKAVVVTETIQTFLLLGCAVLTTVLVLGVFWNRGNNKAALATFATGCCLGLIYFIIDMKRVGALFLEKPAAGFGGIVTDPVQSLGIQFILAAPSFARCAS